MMFEKIIKLVFEVRKNTQNGAKCPLQLILTLHAIHTSLFADRISFLYFDAGLKHIATDSTVVTGVMLVG